MFLLYLFSCFCGSLIGLSNHSVDLLQQRNEKNVSTILSTISPIFDYKTNHQFQTVVHSIDTMIHTEASPKVSPNPVTESIEQNKRILSSSSSSSSSSTHIIGRYPEVYWVNMDSNVQRREYMERQFTDLGITHQRISAITPNSTLFKLDMLEKPCKRNTDREVAVILSHLVAIHTAIYTPINNSKIDKSSVLSDYAMIMEDDVRWEFHINFEELLKNAPLNAGIFQLVTSNPEAIIRLWNRFNASSVTLSKNLWKLTNWRDTSKGGKHALYWSCQAYLIHKPTLKLFIDDVIHFDPISYEIKGFKIVNSFYPHKCEKTRERPCILANCLFSDTYIYSGGGPTYISRIPLFNGGLIGFKSEIHQEQVPLHRMAFKMINNIVNRLKRLADSNQANNMMDMPDDIVQWEGATYMLKWTKYQYLPSSFLRPLYHYGNGSIII